MAIKSSYLLSSMLFLALAVLASADYYGYSSPSPVYKSPVYTPSPEYKSSPIYTPSPYYKKPTPAVYHKPTLEEDERDEGEEEEGEEDKVQPTSACKALSFEEEEENINVKEYPTVKSILRIHGSSPPPRRGSMELPKYYSTWQSRALTSCPLCFSWHWLSLPPLITIDTVHLLRFTNLPLTLRFLNTNPHLSTPLLRTTKSQPQQCTTSQRTPQNHTTKSLLTLPHLFTPLLQCTPLPRCTSPQCTPLPRCTPLLQCTTSLLYTLLHQCIISLRYTLHLQCTSLPCTLLYPYITSHLYTLLHQYTTRNLFTPLLQCTIRSRFTHHLTNTSQLTLLRLSIRHRFTFHHQFTRSQNTNTKNIEELKIPNKFL
ncbi:hypothetical protein V2J09_016922 [Rumex salicifolius]